MSMRALIEARESVALSGPTDARAIVGAEALKAAGYDPDVYHAVVPAEGMRGGKLNKNDRIYGPPDDVAHHHMRLVQAAREGYVGGWKGHSLPAEEHDLPVDAIRLLDGDVVAMEDGSTLARCLVGILRTTKGTDVHTMWAAGKPTGLSLYGICTAQEHTISKDSPYAPMNPEAVGRRVELRRLKALEKYDVVFDPSFGTFFAPPVGVQATESVVGPGDTPEVIAAAERLRASGTVIETPSGAQRAQERHMDIKDLKALEATFPELVKQLRDETAQKAAAEAVTSVNAQAAADRERVVALEATKVDTETRLKATEAALAQVRADLARKDVANEIRVAVEAWQQGKLGAHVVGALVVKQAELGAFETAEAAIKRADEAFKVAQEVALAINAPVTPAAAQRGGVTGTAAAPDGGAPVAPKTMSVFDVFGTT